MEKDAANLMPLLRVLGRTGKMALRETGRQFGTGARLAGRGLAAAERGATAGANELNRMFTNYNNIPGIIRWPLNFVGGTMVSGALGGPDLGAVKHTLAELPGYMRQYYTKPTIVQEADKLMEKRPEMPEFARNINSLAGNLSELQQLMRDRKDVAFGAQQAFNAGRTTQSLLPDSTAPTAASANVAGAGVKQLGQLMRNSGVNLNVAQTQPDARPSLDVNWRVPRKPVKKTPPGTRTARDMVNQFR